MDKPRPSSVRVLIRPPPSPSASSLSSSSSRPATSQTHIPPPVPSSEPPPSSSSAVLKTRTTTTALSSSAPSQPRLSEGVVVVGFIGGRPDVSSQLINRVVDSNAFGSGNLDKILCVDKEEVRDWFKWRRISYYHDEEKGILYLQFCSIRFPTIEWFPEPSSGFDSAAEEHEFGDLQGMLFMFSVCHVIINIQEGSHLDTRILKNFRVLQAAKHALAPFIRSQITPPVPSRPHSSSSSRPTSSATPSKNSSPGRGGGILSRNASSISLMSGLGSYTSLFPGQCTPVTLFVFIDDFSDVPNHGANVEDSADTTSLNQSSNLSTSARTNLNAKGSASVVVLARPASRSEGGLRKKLQSSLEAQIRFLIKKCRTLSGSELSHSGPRSGGTSTSAPLFSLDASRAVVLLDWFSNQRCESLDFAAGLVEDVLNGKATSDSLLLESHGQIASKEDIISVKEFIYRQSDILRGRGGIANSNSGSATGVGMVAVAAAAAAASAASGKTYTTPELPTLEVWLSSSNHILYGVLSAKGGCLDEIEFSRRKHRPRNTVPAAVEGSVKGADPLDIAVSWLQSGRGLNTKFSTLWCERAVPVAKEVYLKDLPARYPTSLHESHLAKALHAFHSMVRGPAVQLFAKKLEDECTSIWKSGRQLCDAVSLTGKPCMHQRHDIDIGESDLGASAKPHSSGYFFLHACACGRSRRLRSDPFDFESANISSSWFQECDKLLPALKLPEISTGRPIQHFSWSLLRIGGARYYEPAKGLLQSGFCATEKFLLKWTIYLEKQKNLTSLAASTAQQGSMTRPPRVELHADTDVKRTNSMQSYPGDLQNGVKEQRTSLDTFKSDDKNISFGRGLPNFKMRKPFSEVVAGSATTDSAFPPLQHRKLPSSGSYKGMKHSRTRDGIVEGVHAASSQQVSKKSEDISSVQGALNGNNAKSCTDSDPFLQIGSNMVPVYTNGGEMVKSHSLKNVTVYVGFEHECPHGHRFLLSPEHLNDLGSSYSLPEECCISSLSDNNLSDTSKVSKSSRRGKVHRSSNGIIATSISKERDIEKSKEKNADGNPYSDGLVYYSGSGKEQNQISKSVSTKISNFVKDLEGELQSISIGDSGSAFSLLNRNLPVYMKCPHCRLSKNKKDPPKVQFAGTISQLQRIFLVTPPFPIILATCPVVQFESSCLPLSVPEREKKLQFSLGCQVVLPPESFLTLRLPFVYGVQLEDRSMHPLNPLEHQPEMTAWITKGTTLQILSKGSNLDEGYQTQ